MMECGDFNESALDVLSRAASFVETIKVVDQDQERCADPIPKRDQDRNGITSTKKLIGEESLSKSSTTSAKLRLRNTPSPVNLRNSPSSKELPTKNHKLRRNRERRELSRSFRKDKPKKYSSTEEREDTDTTTTTIISRDEDDDDDDSTDMVIDVKTDGENETMSDDDEAVLTKTETNGNGDVSPVDSDSEDNLDDEYNSSRTIVMMSIEDNDAPLDMTTGNRRQNERNASQSPTSSSTTPPLPINLSGHPSSLSFCPNPRLLNGPFSSTAPPPPYHPLPLNAHYRINHQALNGRRCSPPPHPQTKPSFLLPPPSMHKPLMTVNNSLATTLAHLQQRPSVITCASALMQQRSTSLSGSSSSSSSLSSSSIHGKNRLFSDPSIVTSSTFAGGGTNKGPRREILSGIGDPDIDEHFRRSLGKNYPEFLTSSSSSSQSPSPLNSVTGVTTAVKPIINDNCTAPSSNPPSTLNGTSICNSISISGVSVDDHFAKALGETWLRLQGKMTSTTASSSSTPSSLSSGSPSPVAVIETPQPTSSPPIQQKPRHRVVSS